MSPRMAKTWAGITAGQLRERWGREAVHVYGVVESTNDIARDLAAGGAPPGTVVLAREQTAGRGRGGSQWVSPGRAGLYLSMLFRPPAEDVTPLVTILAGIDVAIALRGACPETEVLVKWPNDLMLRERKLGGILAERVSGPASERLLVVGVGVNVHGKRLPGMVKAAIALDEVVSSADLITTADAVIEGLLRRLPDPPEALDDAALDEADRLDWLKERRVRHRIGEREPLEGVPAGIAPDGALLLRPDRGALRRVVAGSIEVLDD